TLKVPENKAVLGQVEAGSPADEAGLQAGDHILSADGRSLETWSEWVEYVRGRPGETMELILDRNGERTQTRVTPALVEEDGERFGRVGVGLQPQPWPDDMVREYRYGPIEAFVAGVDRTWQTSGFV